MAKKKISSMKTYNSAAEAFASDETLQKVFITNDKTVFTVATDAVSRAVKLCAGNPEVLELPREEFEKAQAEAAANKIQEPVKTEPEAGNE